MDIMMTNALATISQALSPLLGTGVGAAVPAAGASAAAAAAGAAAVAAGASTAGLSSAHAPPDKPTGVGRPGYISDPVIDTSKNQIIYAHCVAPTKVFGPGGPT